MFITLQPVRKIVSLLEAILRNQEKEMGAIADFAAATNTKLAAIVASVDGIGGDITNLKALVEQLTNQLGNITPEDQALLDQIGSTIDGLVAKTAALDAETP